MMLKPVNVKNSRLNTDLLQFYDDKLSYSEVNRLMTLHLMQEKIISCSAWWDPAFGSREGDNSVLAIIFTDEKGHHYLHHIEYIEIDQNSDEDEASLQCRIVVQILSRYCVPSVAIEVNGLGKFLPAILRRELAKQNVPCAVVEKISIRDKNTRILEAFDVVMAARALNIHQSVKNPPFLIEMADWQPSRKSNNDDGLDAVAGALSLEPVRIQRSVITAQRKWFSGHHSFQAETDFKV